MISARQVGYVSPTIEDMTIQNILIRQDKKVLTDTHRGQDLFEHRFIGIRAYYLFTDIKGIFS